MTTATSSSKMRTDGYLGGTGGGVSGRAAGRLAVDRCLRALAVVAVYGATLAACGGAAFADDRRIAEGHALFTGSTPLTARVTGDTDVLPAVASRCVNCHERAVQGITRIDRAANAPLAAYRATVRPDSDASTYASALDSAWLTTSHVRHGGPATRYDQSSFCTLIRTGVDPAQVMIPPVMPRYDASDAQCESLWAFLRSR